MGEVSTLVGWLVFNVAIPLLAPFALLPFAKVAVFSRSRSQGIVRRAIQDGQLLWAAIPISASACYALACWIDQSDGESFMAWALMGLHVALIVADALLVMLGTLDAYPRSRRKRGELDRVLYLSVVLSIASAGAYAYAEVVFVTGGT